MNKFNELYESVVTESAEPTDKQIDNAKKLVAKLIEDDKILLSGMLTYFSWSDDSKRARHTISILLNALSDDFEYTKKGYTAFLKFLKNVKDISVEIASKSGSTYSGQIQVMGENGQYEQYKFNKVELY